MLPRPSIVTRTSWRRLQHRSIAVLSRPVPVDLRYDKYDGVHPGQVELPPLVIVHGMLGARVNWRSIGKRFASVLKRDVYVIDQRNHGSSPHKPAMSLDALVSDLRHFVFQRNLHQVALLGHSLGGKVAMAAALSEPRMVSELIVEDAAPLPYRSVGEFKEYIEKMQSIDVSHMKGRQQIEAAFVEKLPHLARDTATLHFLSSNVVLDTDTGTYVWRCNLDAIHRNFNTLIDWPHFQKPFEKPTLFLRAEKENYIRESHYPAIKTLFPNANIVNMPTHHWIHVEKPTQFIDIVTKFLTHKSLQSDEIQ